MTTNELNLLAEQLAPLVRDIISTGSQGVGEIPKTNSVDGVYSLPALKQAGNTYNVVEVPLTLLMGATGKTPALKFTIKMLPYGSTPTVDQTGANENPAIAIGLPLAKDGDYPVWRHGLTGIEFKYSQEPDTAYQVLFTYAELMPDVSNFSPEGIALLQQPAIEAATEIRSQINEIVNEASLAITNTNSAATAANTATAKVTAVTNAADTATNTANAAAQAANIAKDAANLAATAANTATTNVTAAKEAANAAATNANEAKEAANTATARANTAAANNEALNTHPAKIQDGTWWLWSLETKTYTDTTVPARGPVGKAPVVLTNGNYGNWDETSQSYVDSGVYATTSVDLQNAPVSFTEAPTRVAINSEETLPTLFGKIKKWFSDLGSLAWKSSVNFSTEVTNKPTTVSGYGITDAGDMRKSVYDTDNDGVVDRSRQADSSSNADKLEGFSASDFSYKNTYNPTKGILIKTKVKNTSSAIITIHITGSPHGTSIADVRPSIDTYMHAYVDVGGKAARYGSVHNGYNIGDISIFTYNEYLHFWAPVVGANFSYKVYGWDNFITSGNRIDSVSDSAIPSEGVTNLVKFTPKQSAMIDYEGFGRRYVIPVNGDAKITYWLLGYAYDGVDIEKTYLNGIFFSQAGLKSGSALQCGQHKIVAGSAYRMSYGNVIAQKNNLSLSLSVVTLVYNTKKYIALKASSAPINLGIVFIGEYIKNGANTDFQRLVDGVDEVTDVTVVSTNDLDATVPNARLLVGEREGGVTVVGGNGTIQYQYTKLRSATGMFPADNNANSILALSKYNGDYYSQLGFSSNGGIYYRSFNSKVIDTTTPWRELVFADTKIASSVSADVSNRTQFETSVVVTSPTNAPVTAQLCIINLSAAAAFSAVAGLELGRVVLYKLNNTTAADLVIPIPTTGGYISRVSSITVKANSWAEISVAHYEQGTYTIKTEEG